MYKKDKYCTKDQLSKYKYCLDIEEEEVVEEVDYREAMKQWAVQANLAIMHVQSLLKAGVSQIWKQIFYLFLNVNVSVSTQHIVFVKLLYIGTGKIWQAPKTDP